MHTNGREFKSRGAGFVWAGQLGHLVSRRLALIRGELRGLDREWTRMDANPDRVALALSGPASSAIWFRVPWR